MNKRITILSKVIEEISQDDLSGCLLVSDPRDNSVSWKLYLNGSYLQYVTSAVGQKERLACLFQQFQPNLTPPAIASEDSEYEELSRWYLSQEFSPSDLREIFLKLNQEALAQVLTFGKTSVEFFSNHHLKSPLIAYPWDYLSEKSQALVHEWQQLRTSLLSPFTRLYLDDKSKYDFYKLWQNLNKMPEALKFFRSEKLSLWLQILSQKNSLYQIAAQIGVAPVTVARQFQPMVEAGVIQVLPFQELEKQPSSVVASRPVVACIDDSKTVQRQVKMTLEPAGYQVLSITEPASTLTMLVRQKPVLILMDINMPEINGYELCQMLSRSRKLRDIPVVMLTGREGLTDRFRAKLVGATHYLTKPFDPNQLIDVVQSLAPLTQSDEYLEPSISFA
ncbi:MAG: response regulator [Xenococcaceae cyanobacterium]